MKATRESDGNPLSIEVLVDARMLPELFINRSGFVEEVETLLLNMEQSQQIKMHATELGLNKVYFYGEKVGGKELAEYSVSRVKAILGNRIIPIDQSLIQQARAYSLRDFDAAIDLVCAITFKLGAIVTQNLENFSGADLSILSVTELLERKSLDEAFMRGSFPVLLVGKLSDAQTLERILENSAHCLSATDLSGTNLSGTDLSGFNLSGDN